jgi:hypothetical protein
VSLSFGLYPNVYATGALSGLRQMLERVWVKDHQPGDGTICLMSGFANFNGGASFYRTFAEHVDAGGKIYALFGGSTSQRLTSRQVVTALLECGARVVIVNRKRLLHAKLYGVLSTAGKRSLVVSSGNFTGPGLAQNIEAALLVEDPLLTSSGFDWNELIASVEKQRWLFYEVDRSQLNGPAWQLLYDETPGVVQLDESEEVTLVVRLGHSDTARIQAAPGSAAGKGSQYIWLSQDCFDFFPPLTIRNQRGIKGTLSAKISLTYVGLGETREETVTFEAENNLDFRLGTGALRYTKLAAEGDFACVTRMSETEYQLRLIRPGDHGFADVDRLAVSFIGNRGKRYGFASNDDFAAILGTSLSLP